MPLNSQNKSFASKLGRGISRTFSKVTFGKFKEKQSKAEHDDTMSERGTTSRMSKHDRPRPVSEMGIRDVKGTKYDDLMRSLNSQQSSPLRTWVHKAPSAQKPPSYPSNMNEIGKSKKLSPIQKAKMALGL